MSVFDQCIWMFDMAISDFIFSGLKLHDFLKNIHPHMSLDRTNHYCYVGNQAWSPSGSPSS